MPKTLRYAVKHSFPIFISFIPVGLAYGVAAAEKRGFNLALRDPKAFGNALNGVQEPVAPQEDIPLFLAECGKETVQRLLQGQLIKLGILARR